jgi:hypothetical protein
VRRIEKAEFYRMVPPDWPPGQLELHREIQWSADEDHLGIVILDLVDKDYSFVSFRRRPFAASSLVRRSQPARPRARQRS